MKYKTLIATILGILLGVGTVAYASTLIQNNQLQNPSVTVNGTSIGLGGSGTVTAASSTLLANNNTFSGLNKFTNTSTTTFGGGISFTRFNLTATSTGSQGISLTGGCFAVKGSCLSSGGASYWTLLGNNIYNNNNSGNGFVGIGSTTPYSPLEIKSVFSTTLASTSIYGTTGTYSWTVPSNTAYIIVKMWGGGGGGGSNSGATGGTAGTGYAAGGTGGTDGSDGQSGGGGGGSSAFGTLAIAAGGGGGSLGTSGQGLGATGTSGGTGGTGILSRPESGGGGGAATAGSNGGGAGGAGGTGATSATGTSGNGANAVSPAGGGGSSAGTSGNGNNASGSTGGTGSGGATPGTNGATGESGGGGSGDNGAGGIPGAGGAGQVNGNGGGAGAYVTKTVTPGGTLNIVVAGGGGGANGGVAGKGGSGRVIVYIYQYTSGNSLVVGNATSTFSISKGDTVSHTSASNLINEMWKAIIGTTTYIVQEIDGVGHLLTGGPTPAVSACGTAPSIYGNDRNFRVYAGSGVITSCTVTFANAYTNPPMCIVTPEKGSLAFDVDGSSTPSTVTISGGTITSDVFVGVCQGYQ